MSSSILGEKDPSNKILEEFQTLTEFIALPALAALVGHDLNVTAKNWPISILLYRMAISSEQKYKTEEKADIYLNEKHPSRKKVSHSLLS